MQKGYLLDFGVIYGVKLSETLDIYLYIRECTSTLYLGLTTPFPLV